MKNNTVSDYTNTLTVGLITNKSYETRFNRITQRKFSNFTLNVERLKDGSIVNVLIAIFSLKRQDDELVNIILGYYNKKEIKPFMSIFVVDCTNEEFLENRRRLSNLFDISQTLIMQYHLPGEVIKDDNYISYQEFRENADNLGRLFRINKEAMENKRKNN